jgi:hypothetical protein
MAGFVSQPRLTIRKHPVRAAGGSGHAASLAALGVQFQGIS